MHETTFTVSTTSPFRFDLTVWVLRRRAKNSVDRFDGHSYSRVLVLDSMLVELIASQINTSEPKLEVGLHSEQKLSGKQQQDAEQLVRSMFGLSVNLQPFYTLVAREPALREMADQFRGMRPTRYPAIFEALVNAIACQQVSLDAGITVLNRLAERYGPAFKPGDTTLHAFPGAEDLVDISEEDLRQLGFSYQKARAIKSLAFDIANGDIELDQLESAANEEVIAYLQQIRGIGRWSAEYVLLRGLGRLDVFPGDDIGGQNNVQKLLQLGARPGYDELGKLTARWHPYAGLIYFHLLLNKLHGKGLV